MGAETFKVHLDGKTQVHLKGLPGMDVKYNKVVTMKGTLLTLYRHEIVLTYIDRSKQTQRPKHNLH